METTERIENGIVIREHCIDGVLIGKEEFPIPANDQQLIGSTAEERINLLQEAVDFILMNF